MLSFINYHFAFIILTCRFSLPHLSTSKAISPVRLFLYEFVTGGGFLATPDEPIATSLLAEGHAMMAALASDFRALPGVEVTTLVDHRLSALPWPDVERVKVESVELNVPLMAQQAARADWTVVIAPETNRALERVCSLVEGMGGRLLGPSSELVQLAADKSTLCAHLSDAHVPVVDGFSWSGGTSWPEALHYPVVLKPRDGAGSQDMRIWREVPPEGQRPAQGSWRIESLHAGTAASVAAICGTREAMILQPCYQHLSDDDRLTYLGGAIMPTAALQQRAIRLAAKAIRSLPLPFGYLGIDMILGADSDGHDDRVVEINPRLTTSYVGLRRACQQNLASAMLELAAGRHVELSWHDRPIEFTAAGEVKL